MATAKKMGAVRASPAEGEARPSAVAADPDSGAAAVAEAPKRSPLRIRHYLQRFHEVRSFIWAKRRVFGGRMREPGEDVNLAELRPGKIRVLWDAGYVQAKDWTREGARLARAGRRRQVG